MNVARLRSVVGFLLLVAVAGVVRPANAEDSSNDASHPFRTDSANANLPWYQPRPGEFPPHGSAHRVGGELVSADFIRRTGQFRASRTGELIDFIMPPYGSVNYLNTDADLRDVPLGTFFVFFLNQDSHGKFTRLATMQDQYSMDAGQGWTYRLDALNLADGKLLTTKQNVSKQQPGLGKRELLVDERTRLWKGDKQIKPSDLAVGDELLFNLTGTTAENPGRCTDIWVGAETHNAVTNRQRLAHAAFIKKLGIAGWIDRVEGNKLTVTLFSGDPARFMQTYMGDFAMGKDFGAVVANDELRTWNPPVDREHSNLIEIKTGPVEGYGTSGVQLVFTVKYMLEGFRKGRVVRIFAPGWPCENPPYGESLMNYGYSALKDTELVEMTPKEYPTQFPFRTDYENETLPWYRLKEGQVPPKYSEHLVIGDLVKVDAGKNQGQFRTERTGELVDFTLIPHGQARCRGSDAKLADLPVGVRYRFSLYQDEKGAFTQASQISDEASYFAANSLSYHLEAMQLDHGKLYAAKELAEVKNYNGDMERPPAIGRTELLVTSDTRVWKGNAQVKLSDLSPGDELRVNLTSEQPQTPSRCTDLWLGPFGATKPN
ncbi:MAG TPA: hypothetical protein VLJ39_11990 [Tepidisphaeraceae bacterium]|nr:hypothetical protein [Tepidisphaeraceae bacterium]